MLTVRRWAKVGYWRWLWRFRVHQSCRMIPLERILVSFLIRARVEKCKDWNSWSGHSFSEHIHRSRKTQDHPRLHGGASRFAGVIFSMPSILLPRVPSLTHLSTSRRSGPGCPVPYFSPDALSFNSLVTHITSAPSHHSLAFAVPFPPNPTRLRSTPLAFSPSSTS